MMSLALLSSSMISETVSRISPRSGCLGKASRCGLSIAEYRGQRLIYLMGYCCTKFAKRGEPGKRARSCRFFSSLQPLPAWLGDVDRHAHQPNGLPWPGVAASALGRKSSERCRQEARRGISMENSCSDCKVCFIARPTPSRSSGWTKARNFSKFSSSSKAMPSNSLVLSVAQMRPVSASRLQRPAPGRRHCQSHAIFTLDQRAFSLPTPQKICHKPENETVSTIIKTATPVISRLCSSHNEGCR